MFIVFTFKFNNKADEFIDEVLREERDLQDSNQKSKTCKKRRQWVKKKQGYIIKGDSIITWAFGHILKLAEYGDWGNPNQNTNEWPNTTYAKVFGVEKFVVVEGRDK